MRVETDGTVTANDDALRGTDVWNATLGPSQAFGSSALTVVYQRYADPCVTNQVTGRSLRVLQDALDAHRGSVLVTRRPGERVALPCRPGLLHA